MRRKLILIFLSLAIFSSVFAVLSLALDGEITDADEAIEVEKKKLSEFTDAELLEYLSDKDITFMQIPYNVNPLYNDEEDFLRDARYHIEEFEENIDSHIGIDAGFTGWGLMADEMCAVVEEYYDIKNTIGRLSDDYTREHFREMYGLDDFD